MNGNVWQVAPPVLVGPSAGGYSAFPASATDSSGKTITAWQRASQHAGNAAMLIQFSTRSTPTGSWSAPATLWDDTTTNVGVAPIGLVWMPARGAYAASWVLLAQRATYNTSGGVSLRQARLVTSPTGSAWTSGTLDPFVVSGSGVQFCFPSDLAWYDDGTDAGQLWAAAYATYSTSGGKARPVLIVSLDRGATWTHVGSPYGANTTWHPSAGTTTQVPTGLSEPTFYFTSGTAYAVHAIWRCDADNTFRTCGLTTGAAGWSTPQWSPVRAVRSSVSGKPNLIVTSDGTWHLFGRDTEKRLSDQYHYQWGWWTSSNGVDWVTRSDFTGLGRAGMYASTTTMPDGSLLVVHGDEDGPQWGPCSVYASGFTAPDDGAPDDQWTIRDIKVWDGTSGAAAPAVVIDVDGPVKGQQVWRHTATGDDGLGGYIFDPARSVPLRPLGDAMGTPPGQWWDFEVTQGQTYAYGMTRDTAEAGTAVVVPESAIWLIPLNAPDKAASLHIRESGFGIMQASVTQAVVDVPGATNSYAVDFGRSNPTLPVEAWVIGDEATAALRAALESRGPYYLSAPPLVYPADLTSPYVMAGADSWSVFLSRKRGWKVAFALTPVDRPAGSARVKLPGYPGLPSRYQDLPGSYAELGN